VGITVLTITLQFLHCQGVNSSENKGSPVVNCVSALSPPCTWPFLSMVMISYPCKVLCAVSKEKKPIPGLVSRLMNRWSCSIRVLRYLLCRGSQATASIPTAFNSLKALRYAAFFSTVITRGVTVWEAPSAFTKRCLAACASRVALRWNSHVFPWESTARERSIPPSLTFTEVSSPRQESVAALR
jgi:hypothetical protein